MHPTGFEPVTFQWKTDYESGAFNHSATDATDTNDTNDKKMKLVFFSLKEKII